MRQNARAAAKEVMERSAVALAPNEWGGRLKEVVKEPPILPLPAISGAVVLLLSTIDFPEMKSIYISLTISLRMIIQVIKIEPAVAIKIFEKYNVRQEEIFDAFSEGKPHFRRVGGHQYVAIAQARNRCLTIFFRYDQRTKGAEITTAYPSSKSQVKFYRKV